jgi:ferredoxin-NADP reductase
MKPRTSDGSPLSAGPTARGSATTRVAERPRARLDHQLPVRAGQHVGVGLHCDAHGVEVLAQSFRAAAPKTASGALSWRVDRELEVVAAHAVRLDARALATLAPALRERDVYICGPDGFTAALAAAAREAGVDPDRIHHESFAF